MCWTQYGVIDPDATDDPFARTMDGKVALFGSKPDATECRRQLGDDELYVAEVRIDRDDPIRAHEKVTAEHQTFEELPSD